VGSAKSWESPATEQEVRLILEMETEIARWRRRTMFLLSVILHGILTLIILFSPNLFHFGAKMLGVPLETAHKDFTPLFISPQLLKKLQQPPPDTNNISSQNQRAQGKSPVINPNGLKMPYSPGKSPVPEVQGGQPKPQTPPPGAGEEQQLAQNEPPKPPQPPPPKPQDDKPVLRLDDITPPSAAGRGSLRLPAMTPGQAIQQSLQSAVQGRGRAPAPGYGDAPSEFGNANPNFSTEGPVILSDTRGVDFGPYLARIVYIVRQNWLAIIPESARLGQRGRTSVVFEILKDGSVPQLRLVSSSGADALDRAAVGGIRASIPFPPLPQEFTGQHLVLQFIFLYNVGVNQ
jgi:TonB family protein